MNVGSFPASIGSVGQSPSNGAQVKVMDGGGFGSVFNTMVASNAVVSKPEAVSTSESEMNEAMTAILEATSVEEIIAVLKGLKADDNPLLEQITKTIDIKDLLAKVDNGDQSDIIAFLKLPELEQLVNELELNFEGLMEQLIPLLEAAGLSESELEAAKYSNDIWSLIDIVDQVAPKFFAELTNALEGKGAIPKEDAVQLLAILKAVVLEAPKTDLLDKQEQQVFTLQGFLAVAAEKLETVQPANQNRQTVLQMLGSQQAIRIIPQAQTGQNQANDESLKESPKETIQQPVIAPIQQSSMREEVRLAQPEANNNARNEALMKELQNVFKRSNFGQAGGTNRLLVKLYPEHLGQVRIELVQNNGIMTARILASSALGREMLDSQLHQLRAAFAQQNLQVERIDISQSLQDASRNDKDNAFNQHFKKEQEQAEQEQEQNSEEEISFQEYMIELEA